MKIVISSRGSRGDIYPVIEIATALMEAGHDVVMGIPETFGEIAERKGLNAHLYPEDSGKVMKEMGSGMNASKGGLSFIASSVHQQMDFMMDAAKDADVLLASVSEIAAPTVGEYFNIPFYRLAYAPVLPGTQPHPLLPFQGLSPRMNELSWKTFALLSRYIVNKFVNNRRKELGLKPAKNPNRYFTGKSHTLLGINSTLAPPCPTWEKRYKFSYTGYCFGKPEGELSKELTHFIEQGSKPVYIGFGSVHIKNPDRFTGIVIEASNRSGVRVVLSRGWTGLGKKDYPDTIFVTEDTNHSLLFPLMAGVMHHGGSGTTHTGAKAGVPQFIMPEIIDQYYWGNRVYKLGLGPRPVSSKKLTVKKIAEALTVLSNGQFRETAIKMGKKMEGENGVPEIVRIITNNNATP